MNTPLTDSPSRSGVKRSELGPHSKNFSLPGGFHRQSYFHERKIPASTALKPARSVWDREVALKVASVSAAVVLIGAGAKWGYEQLTMPRVPEPNPLVAGEIVKAYHPEVTRIEWSYTTGATPRDRTTHKYQQPVLSFSDNLNRKIVVPLGPAIDQHEHEAATGYEPGVEREASKVLHGGLIQISRVEEFGSAGTRVTAFLPASGARAEHQGSAVGAHPLSNTQQKSTSAAN